MKADIQSKNAYEILGVPRSADTATIRKAFRALAIQHHPDARPPDEKKAAAEAFARINQAHEVLRDSEKRKKYDALVDRGQTPDLGQDLAEQGRFASLSDIVGEVKSLGLSNESETLLAKVDEELREKLLKPMLISGQGFKESVADVIPFTFTEKGDGIWEKLSVFEQEALGSLTTAILIVTELRLILLLKYDYIRQEGNTQYTRTSYRSYGIPYGMIEDLLFHEMGRFTQTYRIEVKTQDALRLEMALGTSTDAGAYGSSRLTRLFLVANIHKLPLRIQTGGNAGSEYFEATAAGCLPVVAWMVPFIVSSICVFCSNLTEKGKSPQCDEHWRSIAAFMNTWFITTALIYSIPVLIAWAMFEVYAKWALRRPEHVFGSALATDFATDPPLLGDAAPHTSAPAARETMPSPPPSTLPAQEPEAGPASPSEPLGATPIAVALPDSILEAFGDDLPSISPASTEPAQASPQIVPCPECGHPNRVTIGIESRCSECGVPMKPLR
jgi:hypothetical protein